MVRSRRAPAAAGLYTVVGRPAFAVRDIESPERQDMGGLISLLVKRVHQKPDDVASWVWLGRAYESANDADDAVKALARAVSAAQARHALSPALLSAYGEALVRSAQGIVTPDAERAFNAVLAAKPNDPAARYFLGFAYASRGENEKALTLWKSLLADLPQNSALRADLVDRMASLSARTGTAPNIGQMVEGLSTRLQVQPDDPAGWQRLIRAWTVLGDRDKAQSALGRARAALAKHPEALVALDSEATELKLK